MGGVGKFPALLESISALCGAGILPAINTGDPLPVPQNAKIVLSRVS